MALRQEVWHQLPTEPDMWLSESGLLVNTAALEERTYYYDVVRMPALLATVTDFKPVRKLGEKAQVAPLHAERL